MLNTEPMEVSHLSTDCCTIQQSTVAPNTLGTIETKHLNIRDDKDIEIGGVEVNEKKEVSAVDISSNYCDETVDPLVVINTTVEGESSKMSMIIDTDNDEQCATPVVSKDVPEIMSTASELPSIVDNCISNSANVNCPFERNDSDAVEIIDNVANINTESENRTIHESNVSQDIPTIEESSLRLFYNWSCAPRLLCSATKEYIPTNVNENFTKGCQWSPDGTCLFVPAEDFRIRIYDLPNELYSGKTPPERPSWSLQPAVTVKEGGLIYDSCWYPLMNSWHPETCCFLSTSKESPLHLWDAFTGELRATYRPYNQVDEVEAAISVQFIEEGTQVWCGFKGALRSFDTERPGRQKETISFKKDFPNVSGLVSCIRENPIMPGLIAFGTYSKCIGLYKDGPLCSLRTGSGVTQIEFSPCGTKLYSAVRRSNEFLCWDLRNPGVVLYSLNFRQSNTNQRIQFSISNDGTEIVSGGTDGFINVWRLSDRANENQQEDISPSSRIRLSHDCINGVNMHKSLPILATSSGQRLCSNDDDENQSQTRDNAVKLWLF